MRNWRLVRFEPFDVLMASDARALGDGGFGFAGELSPAAFAGALRTLILKQNSTLQGGRLNASQELDDVVGLSGPPKGFAFAGPLMYGVALSPQLLWPCPMSLVTGSRHSGAVTGILTPGGSPAVADAGMGELRLLEVTRRLGRANQPMRGWLWTAGLKNLLFRRAFPSIVPEATIFLRERKWGHRRAPTGVVEEGMLYSRSALRFQPATEGERLGSAAFQFAGLLDVQEKFLPSGSHRLRLGGDGSLAFAQVEKLSPLVEDNELLDLASGIIKSRKLLLYLATPAIFAGGFRPRKLEEAWKDTVQPVAACVGRPQIIGGWDLKRQAPKAVRWAVPAGSVFYFELKENANDERVREFIFTYSLNASVSDEQQELGFGLTWVGLWPDKEDA